MLSAGGFSLYYDSNDENLSRYCLRKLIPLFFFIFFSRKKVVNSIFAQKMV